MKQYKFSLKDECMKELPSSAIKEYEKYLSLLQSIPVPKGFLNQFEDGRIYNEDEFEICNYQGETFAVSIIKQKVDDTELWNEVLNALGYGFVNREKFIKEAQQRYTITRKNNQ